METGWSQSNRLGRKATKKGCKSRNTQVKSMHEASEVVESKGKQYSESVKPFRSVCMCVRVYLN